MPIGESCVLLSGEVTQMCMLSVVFCETLEITLMRISIDKYHLSASEDVIAGDWIGMCTLEQWSCSRRWTLSADNPQVKQTQSTKSCKDVGSLVHPSTLMPAVPYASPSERTFQLYSVVYYFLWCRVFTACFVAFISSPTFSVELVS